MANYRNSGYDDYYGDYYTPSYASTTSKGGWKSRYSGGWSKTWSSYSFVVDYDDDTTNLFVIDPVNYIKPTIKDIKK